MIRVSSVILLTVALFQHAESHGRLLKPPSRASMWRVGFQNPPDYNDNQGFCGGRVYQMNQGGKCGICGDRYGGPKPHEAPGGKYANGIIVETYQSGQNIEVEVQLTANHKGYFEFKLCPNNNVAADKGQWCFDQYPLQVLNGDGYKYTFTSTNPGKFKAILRLPAGLTCSQCILQWEYTTGNHWGYDPVTGNSGLGVNPLQQEHFVACADITITGNGSGNPPSPPTPTPSPPAPTPAPPSPTPAPPAPTPAPPPSGGNCYAVGPFSGNAAMNAWCNTNCNHVPPFCPASHCACN